MTAAGGGTTAPLLTTLLVSACLGGTRDVDVVALEARLRQRIAASPAETVGLYFRSLEDGDSVLIDADVRMHAASTVNVPIMIQVFRDAEEGRFRVEDSVLVVNRFLSALGTSWYALEVPEDNDPTMYDRIGEYTAIRYLLERMIGSSSNLAGNTLIGLVGAARTQRTVRRLGADSMEVRRGVEDLRAFEIGLNNTTTARDLGTLLYAIARDEAASPAACREMVELLLQEEATGGIPAGVPAGTRVAHKNGWIPGIEHDAGIVYPQSGPPYVLAVLTRGIEERAVARRLIADLSRITYAAAVLQ